MTDINLLDSPETN